MTQYPTNVAQADEVQTEEEAQKLAQETAQTMKSGPLTGKPIESKPTEKPNSEKKSKKAASAFRTISEVADILDVQQHVLRFWETKFSQIRPLKRGGGRRYYRPEDLELLKRIHHLLYTEGYTIKGVQKLLREKGKAAVLSNKPQQAQNNNEPSVSATVKGSIGNGMNPQQRAAMKSMIGELKALRDMLKSD